MWVLIISRDELATSASKPIGGGSVVYADMYSALTPSTRKSVP